MRRLTKLGLAVALVLSVAAPSQAGPGPGKPARSKPQGPAAVKFAKDFPRLIDHEWRFALGGFGGVRKGAPLRHVPVIFVHGNNVDAADWYPVRDDFRAAGWSNQELWGLSYNGLGANNGTAIKRTNPERDAEHTAMGWDGQVRITEDDVNVADLYDFIRAVQAYTGSAKIAIVGHSLGVTLARETLRLHPTMRKNVVAFIGIAGPNHGTDFCPPGSEGQVVSCDEIAAGTPWLTRLNAAGETWRGTKWLVVYDGSGVGDPAYAGPSYATSPILTGATRYAYPYTYHNDLRVDTDIVHDYRLWLEAAIRPAQHSR